MQYEPGTQIGKYRLVREIGSGAMGTVFEAEHVFIRRRFAIKLLKPELIDNDAFKKRVLRESQATAAISHPNVVEVSDYGETDEGAPFIVMEFLEGEPLGDLLDREGPIYSSQSVHLAIEILKGLEAAHKQNIIHRDIKPDNVFILSAEDPAFPRVKLVDFGISRFRPKQDVVLTQAGLVMGTPLYMSLEQASGSANIDGRSDIYSVGVMLFEMLSDELPYEEETLGGIIAKMVQGPAPDLRHLAQHLPVDLPPLVHRAIAVNANERFASAREFRLALEQYWENAKHSRDPTTKHKPLTSRELRAPTVAQQATAAATGPAREQWGEDSIAEGENLELSGLEAALVRPTWHRPALVIALSLLVIGGGLGGYYFRGGSSSKRTGDSVQEPPPVSLMSPTVPASAAPALAAGDMRAASMANHGGSITAAPAMSAIERPKPTMERPKPTMERPKPTMERPKPAMERPKPTMERPKPAMERPKPAMEPAMRAAPRERPRRRSVVDRLHKNVPF